MKSLIKKAPGRQIIALALCGVMVFGMAFTLFPPRAGAADTIDKAVDDLHKVGAMLILDTAGESAVVAAKAKLALMNSFWPNELNFLITNAVKTKLGGGSEAVAKQKILDFVHDAAVIQYATDEAMLRSALQAFKAEHAKDVTDLLGSDFTVDDLYNYLLAAKGQIPNVITEDIPSLIAIATGDYTNIRDHEKKWMRSALTAAATGDYSKFLRKLGDIGWSIDTLVQAKDAVNRKVDPGYAGEIALMKAYVRSETHFLLGSQELNLDNDINLSVGDTLQLKLEILGYAKAGQVLNWFSQNSGVATVDNGTKTLTAAGAGDTILIAYRSNPETDWAYRVNIHVHEPGMSLSATSVREESFSDVDSHWAGGEIKRMTARLAAKGYPDGTFKPENYITRGEFATILAKAMLWPTNDAADNFSDNASIPGWARGYVGAAVTKGAIKGCEGNTFQADRLITRAEAAVMMVRALGKGTSGKAPSFADADSVPSWAAGYVDSAVVEGIVKGAPGNVFNPNDCVTRAEAATMVYRLLKALKY